MHTQTFEQIKQHLEHAQLAGHIYQQDQILVLQEPFSETGEALNIFVQHEITADQLGFQFAIQVLDDRIDFLIGVTHSNQDRSSEIGTWSLKGEQKAFNLCYAFYNYPKHFYILRYPIQLTEKEATLSLQQQLSAQVALDFINTALKTNQAGEPTPWMKEYILKLCLSMQQRLRTVCETV